MSEILTAKDILDYQERKKNLKPFTVGNFKELGRELRDRFGLTDREALDILADRNCILVLAQSQRREKNGEQI